MSFPSRRPTFGPPPSAQRSLADRSPVSTSSSFEDALRRLDLGGPGSDASPGSGDSSPGSGDSSPASSTPRSITAAGGTPDLTESEARQSGACGRLANGAPDIAIKDSLDDFLFPASTFTSPSFANASYAPTIPKPSDEFPNSILQAPTLPSTARFATPDLGRYGPLATSSLANPAADRKQDELSQPASARPAEGHRGVGGAHGLQGLRIVSAPQRDAFEIAAEQGRMRASVAGQQIWPSSTDNLLRSMSVEQLSRLPHEQLARLIDIERARCCQPSASPPAGLPWPLWASTPTFTSEAFSSPTISPSSGQGPRARSHTSPALAAGRFDNLHLHSYDNDLDAQTTAVISSYFDGHVSRPPAREHLATHAPTHAVGHGLPLSTAAASFGGSAGPYFSGAGLLALPPPRTTSRSPSSPVSPGAGFSVKLDGGRPSTFASSPASLHSPALTQPPPSPRFAGAHSPSTKISAQSPEVLARLQAIRLLHPGAYGTHPAPASAGGAAAVRQTPPHLDLALQGRGRAASIGNGGTSPRSFASASGHGLSPAIMDPALQQYLAEHGLPIDAPSPTNKKIQLYKTEKCRSWERNVDAATPEERCVYGAKCQYAHGEHELRPVERHPKYKTQICTLFWLLGECDFGRRCCFLHDDIPSGGIPELGELGTQEALRSILMARRSLYTGGPLDQLGLGPARANSAPALQLSFGPAALAFPRSDRLDAADRFKLSSQATFADQTKHLGHRSSHDSFGSTYPRSPVTRESSPPFDRPLLRPRDRSDSLSVNMAPVPELTAIPPTLPVRTPLYYADQTAMAAAGHRQRPEFDNLSKAHRRTVDADAHTRALAAVQAVHRQGAYQSSTAPAPVRDAALVRQPWSYGSTGLPQPTSVGAIGDRGASARYEVGSKILW